MAGTITSVTTSGKGRGTVRINCAITCVAGIVLPTVIGKAYGRLVGIAFDPVAGEGATLATGADIALTDEDSGAVLWSSTGLGTAALYFRPTTIVTSNAGTPIVADTSNNDVNRDIYAAGKLKLGVTAATTTDTGLISFIFEEAA